MWTLNHSWYKEKKSYLQISYLYPYHLNAYSNSIWITDVVKKSNALFFNSIDFVNRNNLHNSVFL